MNTVIYIHGIGEKPPEPVLKREWDRALFGTVYPTSVMCYWADILHPASDEHVLDFMYDHYLYYVKRLPALNEQYKAIGDNFQDAAMRAFTMAFVRDVYYYFYGPSREAIQERFRRLLELYPGAVVVSHSLGTVIAWEVLNATRAICPLLVTLGSPLGIEPVKAKLRKEHGEPLLIPPGVDYWANFADPLDIVAVDGSCADDYKGGAIEDQVVENLNRDREGYGPHNGEGYLSLPQVRGMIHQWLI